MLESQNRGPEWCYLKPEFFLFLGDICLVNFRRPKGQIRRPMCRNNIFLKHIFMGQLCSSLLRDTFTINIDLVLE